MVRIVSLNIAASRPNPTTVNAELAAKLQSEISMEEDMKEDADLSANIKEYLENSAFEVLLSPKAPPTSSSELTKTRSKTSPAIRRLSSLEPLATRRSASHLPLPT
jgi:hypothetical protein